MSSSRAMSSAAFEIVKGERRIPFVSEREVERCLDLRQLLDGLQAGFGRLDAGVVQVPPRPEITVPDRGYSLAMMAWEPGMQICVKVVNVFEGNLNLALPNHLAMITLFDPDTGAVSCLMDGTYITGIRTAASAAVGVRLLSRADAKVATIVGAGVQAREHLRLLPLVRDLERINICSLDVKHSTRLAERSNLAEPRPDLQASIEESDIVCLATHSPVPVIDPDWVRPGAHVSSVGYCPPDGELPRSLAQQHRLFVETLDAFEPAPVGCADLSDVDPDTATTLGAIVMDPARGRRDADEVTIYKAMGIAMEDMVAANLVFAATAQPQGERDDRASQTVTW